MNLTAKMILRMKTEFKPCSCGIHRVSCYGRKLDHYLKILKEEMEIQESTTNAQGYIIPVPKYKYEQCIKALKKLKGKV